MGLEVDDNDEVVVESENPPNEEDSKQIPTNANENAPAPIENPNEPAANDKQSAPAENNENAAQVAPSANAEGQAEKSEVPAENTASPAEGSAANAAPPADNGGQGDKGAEETAPPADGEAQNTKEDEKVKQQYNMYKSMVISLTLQLPFERDRVIASKWVKKIDTSNDEKVKRVQYFKLLCASMLSHKLVGPFKYIPKETPELDEIANTTLNEIIEDTVEKTENWKMIPYYVEMSGDLKEYTAYQEIPDFGAHFYYAFSNETILNWRNKYKAIVPYGGINSEILNPPSTQISQSYSSFKDAYKQYTAEPQKVISNSRISAETLPNLISELRKQNYIRKEEIARMGTTKFRGGDVYKYPSTSNVDQKLSGPPERTKRTVTARRRNERPISNGRAPTRPR